MEYIPSDHDDFIDTVVFRGGVTTDDFNLCSGKIIALLGFQYLVGSLH